MSDGKASRGRVDPARTAGMSGLEILQAMLAGDLPPSSIRETMHIRLGAAGPGWVEFRGAAGHAHLNAMGAVHGGWYGTLLDSAMGFAVLSRLQPGQGHTTLEYKVNIIRALPPGMEVVCRADCQHAGRSTAIASGAVRGLDDGRLYATGSTTCMVFTPPGLP